MKNILLVFSLNVKNSPDFLAIISKFKKRNYNIYMFDKLLLNNFDLRILPEIINRIKSESKEEIGRIVVLSNIIGIIFVWYRCYNSLINDFIFFMDRFEGILKLNTDDNAFYHQLTNFVNIEEETLQGKIFLTITLKNYKNLFEFLMANSRFKYFDDFNDFDFDQILTKESIGKIYSYNNKEYHFIPENPLSVQRINLHSIDTISKGAKLDDALCKLLDSNLYFLIYFIIESYNRDKKIASPLLIRYFSHLQFASEAKRKKVWQDILRAVNSNLDFHLKIYLLNLSILLNLDECILAKIMEILLQDHGNYDFHYHILEHTLGFISNNLAKKYDGYYSDRRKELTKIGREFRPDFSRKSFNKNPGYIAIIADQLLSLLHSPTRVILDYAIYLKKVYPELKVKIFVEDNFTDNIDNQDLQWAFFYQTANSHGEMPGHLDYLKGEPIEIYYSNPSLSKKERTQKIIEEIIQFSPEVLLTNSTISLATEILYPYYPVIYMFMGGVYCTLYADVYLHSDSENVLAENNKYKLLPPDNIFTFKFGITLPAPFKTITRQELGLADDDFVLITVGNRLDFEISEGFMDLICSFLMEAPKAKWIILGRFESNYIEDKHQELSPQVLKIAYEKDLPSLYRICDVCVNPFREHGGTSILIAMNEGLPIVMTKQRTDATVYVGLENCVEDANAYLDELKRLYNDREYCRRKGLLMKEKIAQYDLQSSVKELVNFFEIAKRKFNDRANKNPGKKR